MDDEALERLEARVEGKAGSEMTKRHPLRAQAESTPHAWKDPMARSQKKSRFWSRFSVLEALFAASIIFFVGAGTVASLLIFSGNNTVSTRNVDVSVIGPTSVRAGDEVSLQIVIANRNAVPMNLTDMLIEFPQGTRSPRDVSVDLPRIRESIGTIDPGASINRTVKAVMFGTAGVPVEVEVTAEYRVPSSNAVFQSSSTYKATISQSPAAIKVETLREVVSGQATDVTVTVTSNATENLTGMLLVGAYPPGFQFESSNPKPVAGSTVWDLGDINPKGTRTVTIRGTFTGEDGDDRVLHFTTGTKKKTDPTSIAAPLASSDASLVVAKPFVSVDLALNGRVTEVVTVDRGTLVEVEVRWANNLPVRIQDVEIAVQLAGGILDRGSVRAGQGFYRSADNTVLFNKETDARFASIEPGQEGVSKFEFRSRDKGSGTFQSPQIELKATVKGNRSSEGGVISAVTSSDRATLQIATDLALSQTLGRLSGPLPLKVDTETQYTVTWQLQNTANAIADTAVTAVLPPYVTWKGSGTSPDVTYNENGRTVTWTVGDMTAGASRSASFQLAVTPSLTQVNNVPVILGDIRVTAFDRFIRAPVERPMAPLTSQNGTSPQNAIVIP
ncbi:MAG: hypothetical protein NBV63_00275 [Candidatus Pacebacteria bacterium]|nr:hypothetical protein [Candidatus Paceibacterota bacterium]